ncbi:MAG: hypothetical protein Q9191_004551 [Dirinaria sp. TL-2023a]
MLSAYLTLILVTVHYLIDRRQQRNSVDRAFLAFVVPKALTIQAEETSERWTQAFDEAVLFLGDTQVVTSIAIVLSGYVQLPCGLSKYHWEMVVDLAWFSALTHLTALTSLRHYFQQRPTMAFWRVLFMGITLVLLGSALKPTGYVTENSETGVPGLAYVNTTESFQNYIASPALCLFNRHRRAEVAESLSSAGNGSQPLDKAQPPFNTSLILISLAYLVISYVTRIIRLSKPAADTATSWIRRAPMNLLCEAYRTAGRRYITSKRLARLYRGFLLVCITLSETLYEIMTSMLWEIVWLLAALLWGTFRLVVLRYNAALVGEDTWGFGQVLSILLSALPLWAFLGTLHKTIHPPLAIDTSVTTMCAIDGLGRPDQHSWFNPLVGFMFGTIVVLAAGTVYVVPGSSLPGSRIIVGVGSDVFYGATDVFVVVYVVAFSCSLLASAIFISLAYALELGIIGSSKPSAWWARFTVNWSPRTQGRVRAWIWTLFILLLVGAQVELYLLVFFWFPPSVLNW